MEACTSFYSRVYRTASACYIAHGYCQETVMVGSSGEISVTGLI